MRLLGALDRLLRPASRCLRSLYGRTAPPLCLADEVSLARNIRLQPWVVDGGLLRFEHVLAFVAARLRTVELFLMGTPALLSASEVEPSVLDSQAFGGTQ